MSNKNLTPAEIIKDFYAQWVSGNTNALNAYWADGAVMETVFSVAPVPPETAPPIMKGGNIIRPYWSFIIDALERRDLKDLWVQGVDDPEWVIARFKGDMLTKNGKAYRNSYHNLIRLKNGKIVEYYEYSNPLVILDAFVGKVSIEPM